MPKNIEDIIVPDKPDRRSIRNIPMPENRRRMDVPPAPTPAPIVPAPAAPQIPRIKPEAPRVSGYPEPNRRNYSKKTLVISGIFAVLVLGFAAFSLFKSASVSYTPKSAELSFAGDVFSGTRSGASGLPFSVIKLSKDSGITAPASGEEKVFTKASGKVIVYNNADKAPQRLVRNTRFETPEGKIYRIQSDITIPGKVGTEPGSLEVNVYADQAGPEYNIGLTDFTLPGLKGDPRFTTIYGRSKTAMTGGFSGVAKKVSADDLTKARASLSLSQKEVLEKEVIAQVPADFILYPGLIEIAYTDLPQSAPTETGVTVNQHADLLGIMFKRSDLSNFLASKKLGSALVGPVNIKGLEDLQVVFSKAAPSEILKQEKIDFEVTGTASAVSIVPEDSLRTDLAGSSKADSETIFNKYPSIQSASAVLRPFWKRSFPTDPLKISLINLGA